MEVIARRYNRVLWLHAFYILSGAGIITGGGFLLTESLPAAIALFLMGAVVGFFGVVLTVLALRTPAEVVKHDGKSLYFPDFFCRVSELNEVRFTTPSRESYGTLYVRVGEVERKYRFVAEVEKVCETLQSLKSRNRKNQEEDTSWQI